MDHSRLPPAWQQAFARDLAEKPALADPLPERRLARVLAAFVISGLFFMILPGTLLGVWNLVGISSQRQAAAVSTPWIQAHGHAQFFGWVGSFIIGISLYTIPKSRGAGRVSPRANWTIWGLWSAGVGLRWLAGVQSQVHQAAFRISGALEVAAVALLLWQCRPSGGRTRRCPAWQVPILAGLAALLTVLAWQMLLVLRPLSSPALPPAENQLLISLVIWTFAFPVVSGYSAKFFPGLIGAPAPRASGLRLAVALSAAAGVALVLNYAVAAAAATLCCVAAACRSLGIFHPRVANPKTAGVDAWYPQFARIAYAWLAVSALMGFAARSPGVLGALRHAFTVGFLATLIFSIGPRILPSFVNSRELWSPRCMRWSLVLLTTGCFLRVMCEPLAYGSVAGWAWKLLPVSAFAELAAILLFGFNLAMSLATPIPAWFSREQIKGEMSLYWLVSSYPATRRLLAGSGLITLARARAVPKSLSLREAARADGVSTEVLVASLGGFFDARLARSLRERKPGAATLGRGTPASDNG